MVRKAREEEFHSLMGQVFEDYFGHDLAKVSDAELNGLIIWAQAMLQRKGRTRRIRRA